MLRKVYLGESKIVHLKWYFEVSHNLWIVSLPRILFSTLFFQHILLLYPDWHVPNNLIFNLKIVSCHREANCYRLMYDDDICPLKGMLQLLFKTCLILGCLGGSVG